MPPEIQRLLMGGQPLLPFPTFQPALPQAPAPASPTLPFDPLAVAMQMAMAQPQATPGPVPTGPDLLGAAQQRLAALPQGTPQLDLKTLQELRPPDTYGMRDAVRQVMLEQVRMAATRAIYGDLTEDALTPAVRAALQSVGQNVTEQQARRVARRLLDAARSLFPNDRQAQLDYILGYWLNPDRVESLAMLVEGVEPPTPTRREEPPVPTLPFEPRALEGAGKPPVPPPELSKLIADAKRQGREPPENLQRMWNIWQFYVRKGDYEDVGQLAVLAQSHSDPEIRRWGQQLEDWIKRAFSGQALR